MTTKTPVKDLVTVRMPNGSERTSEQTTVSFIAIILGVVATIVGKQYGFELSETEIAVVSSGITAIIGGITGIITRWRSKGGVLKAGHQK